MKSGLHVIFGADQNVIAGLHVAALSVLLNYTNKERNLHFHVFTDTLTAENLSVLRKTLDATRIQRFEIVVLPCFDYWLRKRSPRSASFISM